MRRRKPRPVFDYSAGHIDWELEPPPHGVNHATQLARWAPVPHIYKRSESKVWVAYAKGVTGGWVPPARTPLVVVMVFALPKEKVLSLDVDKWAPIVVDAVVGARYDQWVFDCKASKTETNEGQEPMVYVRVCWRIPNEPRR